MIYERPNFKIRWWEKVILWFLPMRTTQDTMMPGPVLCYKVWRGRFYYLREIKEGPPRPRYLEGDGTE